MSCYTDTAVATYRFGDTYQTRHALADVLLVQQCPTSPDALFMELFTRLPGLSLAIVLDRVVITVGCRDGTTFVLHHHGTAATVEALELVCSVVGCVLYDWWSHGRAIEAFAGVDLTVTGSERLTFRVQVGGWLRSGSRVGPVCRVGQLPNTFL